MAAYVNKFRVDGAIIKTSKILDVSKLCDMLVLDFANNGFMPLKVLHLNGEYRLMFDRTDILGRPFRETDVIAIDSYLDRPLFTVGARISVGEAWCYFDIGYDGEITIRKGDWLSIISSTELDNWCVSEFIVRRESCSACGWMENKTGESRILMCKNGLIVDFGDGLKFPVCRVKGAVLAAAESIEIEDGRIDAAFVKCIVRDKDFVRFRLVLCDASKVYRVDDIEFSRDGAKSQGGVIGRAVLAKQLIHTGGSLYAEHG